MKAREVIEITLCEGLDDGTGAITSLDVAELADRVLAALAREGLAVQSADEVDARIEAAVAAERERAERLCEALRYRMNASDFDTLIVAIRKGAEP